VKLVTITESTDGRVPLQRLPLIQRNPVGQPRYYWNEARPELKYTSITSILSATQSENTKYALRRWKQKIIAEGGDPDETRDQAARRGSLIHDWFEAFLHHKRQNRLKPSHLGANASKHHRSGSTLITWSALSIRCAVMKEQYHSPVLWMPWSS
jgi:hypothetical protein